MKNEMGNKMDKTWTHIELAEAFKTLLNDFGFLRIEAFDKDSFIGYVNGNFMVTGFNFINQKAPEYEQDDEQGDEE